MPGPEGPLPFPPAPRGKASHAAQALPRSLVGEPLTGKAVELGASPSRPRPLTGSRPRSFSLLAPGPQRRAHSGMSFLLAWVAGETQGPKAPADSGWEAPAGGPSYYPFSCPSAARAPSGASRPPLGQRSPPSALHPPQQILEVPRPYHLDQLPGQGFGVVLMDVLLLPVLEGGEGSWAPQARPGPAGPTPCPAPRDALRGGSSPGAPCDKGDCVPVRTGSAREPTRVCMCVPQAHYV